MSRKFRYPMLVKFAKGENFQRGHVTSATQLGKRYFVDANEYFGNGYCGCEHFESRLEPRLKTMAKEGMIWDDTYRCKHILAFRMEAGNKLYTWHLELCRKAEQAAEKNPEKI